MKMHWEGLRTTEVAVYFSKTQQQHQLLAASNGWIKLYLWHVAEFRTLDWSFLLDLEY